jgi:hypothetical protein
MLRGEAAEQPIFLIYSHELDINGEESNNNSVAQQRKREA